MDELARLLLEHAPSVSATISALSLLVSATALWVGAQSLRTTQRVALGTLLLRVDDALLLREFNEVHAKLCPGGAWHGGAGGPSTPEEWVELERYVGRFERIYILVDRKLLRLKDVEHCWGRRVRNIMAHGTIRERLLNEAERWSYFVALHDELEQLRAKRKRPRRFAEWLPRVLASCWGSWRGGGVEGCDTPICGGGDNEPPHLDAPVWELDAR